MSMMLIQLLAGMLIACILWGLFRLTFKLLLWGFAATFLLLLIPGGMLLLGGFGLLLLSLFATLGVLFLCSLLLGPR